MFEPLLSELAYYWRPIIICGTKEGISAILWAMDRTYVIMNFTNREDSVKNIYARKILATNMICLFCFMLPSRGWDGQKLPVKSTLYDV